MKRALALILALTLALALPGCGTAAADYTVLTADGSDSFNIRVNGLVREIKHGDVLILGEGDTFCPVSHTVVLR